MVLAVLTAHYYDQAPQDSSCDTERQSTFAASSLSERSGLCRCAAASQPEAQPIMDGRVYPGLHMLSVLHMHDLAVLQLGRWTCRRSRAGIRGYWLPQLTGCERSWRVRTMTPRRARLSRRYLNRSTAVLTSVLPRRGGVGEGRPGRNAVQKVHTVLDERFSPSAIEPGAEQSSLSIIEDGYKEHHQSSCSVYRVTHVFFTACPPVHAHSGRPVNHVTVESTTLPLVAIPVSKEVPDLERARARESHKDFWMLCLSKEMPPAQPHRSKSSVRGDPARISRPQAGIDVIHRGDEDLCSVST